MNGEMPAAKPRDPGRIVIRVIALIMLGWALWQVGNVVRCVIGGTLPQLEGYMGREVFAPWSVATCLMVLLAFFSGIQLFRLRLSGWIASLTFFAVGTGWIACAIPSDWSWLAIRPGMLGLGEYGAINALAFLGAPTYVVYYCSRFALACYFTLSVYLAFEWRRFLCRDDFKPARTFALVKLGVAGFFLMSAGVWNFWADEYVQFLTVAKHINAQPPTVDRDDLYYLGSRRVAQAYARIIRRLERDRTPAVAKSVLDVVWQFRPTDSINEEPLLGLDELTPEDTAALIAASHSADTTVQMACYLLLGEIATKEAKQCLCERLSGPVDLAWKAAYFALAGAGPDEAPDKVLDLSASPGPDRRIALQCLPLFHGPRVEKLLLELARDPHAEVRQQALEGMGHFPDEATERALLASLADSHVQPMPVSFLSLAHVGTQNSIPVLIDCLKKPDISLTQGSPGIHGIKRYLDRPSNTPPTMHDCAEVVLRRITLEDFGKDAVMWEQWWRRNEQSFDMKEKLAQILSAPLPGPPPRSWRDESDPYNRAARLQVMAVEQICYHDFRDLSVCLAHYLAKPDGYAGLKGYVAPRLASWGYREGIDWFFDDPDRWAPSYFRCKNMAQATGQNFFGDWKRWREWWAANRDRFPSALDGEEKATTDGHR